MIDELHAKLFQVLAKDKSPEAVKDAPGLRISPEITHGI
jgi:hypothetical protein